MPCIISAVVASLEMYATGGNPSERKMAAPSGPALPTKPERNPTIPPPMTNNAGPALIFNTSKYFNAMNIMIAAPIVRVTNSFGSWTNETAPKMLNGIAPSKNSPTGFHWICLKPKPALERLPISCAMVSNGTACVTPTVATSSGNNRSAPPNPAAPEIAAAPNAATKSIRSSSI